MTKGVMPLMQDAGIEVVIVDSDEVNFRFFTSDEDPCEWEVAELLIDIDQETYEAEAGFYIDDEWFPLNEFIQTD